MANSARRIEILRKMPALAGVSDDELETLLGKLGERTVRKGELIVEQGSEADELYLVLEGTVQIFLSEESIDLEKTLGRVKPGKIFGEIALLTGGHRTASARAETDGLLLVMRQEEFWELMQKSRTAAVTLCRLLGRHLESTLRDRSPIPFVKLADFGDLARHRHLIPERVSDLLRAVAVDHREDIVKVAMVDPFDPDARHFIGQVVHPLRAEFTAISDADFREFARRVGSGATGEEEGQVAGKLFYTTPSGAEEELGDSSEVDQVVGSAIRTALRAGASDLHFEPRRGRFQIRARIDGNLVDLRRDLDSQLAARILSRLKIMADLDITERRHALDGSFSIRHLTRVADVRLSTVPSIHGEKAVLRLLDDESSALDLQRIVLSKPAALMIAELFQQPSGLVLVTGPTGGGKTTTLYSGLKEIWDRSTVKNIVTIEDPIDRRLDCATQIQVGGGGEQEFHSILRSVLRQDPDVLLIGEMRDHESATIAHEAALTGHLVLSSLHSHFALDVFARLKTLGVAPFLIGSALKGIVSQRLVPALCPACTEEIAAGDGDESLRRLVDAGVLIEEDLTSGRLKRATGCEHCHRSGHKGRVALLEVLVLGDQVRDLVERDAPLAEIRATLPADSFLSMGQYARYLLLGGRVSPAAMLAAFPSSPGAPGSIVL